MLALAAPSVALAQREATRESLVRLEETLGLRLEDGSGQALKDLVPVIVISVKPAYEETKAWYPTAALGTLARIFGPGSVRACEACMAPRTYADDGRLEQVSSDPGVDEIARLDDALRGKGAAARAAVWLDENAEGVSLRVVDLKNSRLVLAENFDATLSEGARTHVNVKNARELERRQRADALTHIFIDATIFPHQHVSMDWTEQWGDSNANLSGFTLTLFDPIVGVGASYYRVLPFAMNLMVGAQVVMSVPTALVKAVTNTNQQIIDPLFTGVLVVRFPIASSNFGLVATLSTNARFGLGISLLNITLLPFLP